MKCFKCSQEAKVNYPNGDLCADCFLDVLYKRVKKEIRTEHPFKKNENVLVFSKLAKVFLEKAIENLPLHITEAKEKYGQDIFGKDFSEYDKVVIPWTADDEANIFFEELSIQSPDFKKLGHTQKIIKIFKPLLDKEVAQAAHMLNLEFETAPKHKLIETIHKKYPSALFGLENAATEFKKAL